MMKKKKDDERQHEKKRNKNFLLILSRSKTKTLWQIGSFRCIFLNKTKRNYEPDFAKKTESS